MRKEGLIEGGLDVGLEPVTFGHVLDVHVFAANGAAVGLLEAIDDFFGGEVFSAEIVVCEEFFIKIFFFKAELGEA